MVGHFKRNLLTLTAAATFAVPVAETAIDEYLGTQIVPTAQAKPPKYPKTANNRKQLEKICREEKVTCEPPKKRPKRNGKSCFDYGERTGKHTVLVHSRYLDELEANPGIEVEVIPHSEIRKKAGGGKYSNKHMPYSFEKCVAISPKGTVTPGTPTPNDGPTKDDLRRLEDKIDGIKCPDPCPPPVVKDCPEPGKKDDSPGTLSGIVYQDTNGDGKQEHGESGIAGVEIKVTDAKGVEYTVTTGADGSYTVTNLPPGKVLVDIVKADTIPNEHVQTQGTDPTWVTLPPGGVATDIDGFGPKKDGDDGDSDRGHGVGFEWYAGILGGASIDFSEGGFLGLRVGLGAHFIPELGIHIEYELKGVFNPERNSFTLAPSQRHTPQVGGVTYVEQTDRTGVEGEGKYEHAIHLALETTPLRTPYLNLSLEVGLEIEIHKALAGITSEQTTIWLTGPDGSEIDGTRKVDDLVRYDPSTETHVDISIPAGIRIPIMPYGDNRFSIVPSFLAHIPTTSGQYTILVPGVDLPIRLGDDGETSHFLVPGYKALLTPSGEGVHVFSLTYRGEHHGGTGGGHE